MKNILIKFEGLIWVKLIKKYGNYFEINYKNNLLN